MSRMLCKATLFLTLLCLAACNKQAPAPPPPPAPVPNMFALLPQPGATPSAITVTNKAGSQEVSQPYELVRVKGNDKPPEAPITISDADAKRIFGSAIEVLPQPEIQFLLHFDEGQRTLNSESTAMIPAILEAIRQRKSTAISVTGHADTVDTPEKNYDVGMQRAQGVAKILQDQGVTASDIFVSSHGDADLLIKTGRNVDEPRNRRVEVIVR